MGWSNFIIIENWKMIIETSKEVYQLDDYIKESLDKMIDYSVDTDINTSDLKVNDMTIKDLCVMAFAYDNASALAGIDTDTLFLYWLKSRDIIYDTKSEFNIDLKEYKKNGYKIIRRWDSDDDNDDDKEDNQDNNKEK